GPVGEADFDGDGLTNAAEIAAALPPDARTDPFIPDTDGDGWNDLREAQQGSSGTNGILTPITQNPNYISLIRSFEVEKLHGSDSYSMARSKNSQGAWSDWSWGQYWNMPGDIGNGGGSDAVKPLTLLRGYPFTESQADTWWQFASGLYFEQFSPPLYISTQPSFYSYAQRGLDTYSVDTYESENAWHGFEWHRYRIVLAETLPYEHREHFLVIAHRYEENPDYGVEGGVNPEYRWKRTDDIESVTSMTLTVPAGALEGGWQYQRPTTYESDTMIVLQVAPVEITLRANPLELNPDDTAQARFTPSPENSAFENIVNNIGLNRLGKLKMGQGRAGEAGGANNAYCAPVEVYATVPDVPSSENPSESAITWKWKRSVNAAWWRVRVAQLPDGRHELVVTQLGNANEPDDDPMAVSSDYTRSPSSGRIYTSDSSGVKLSEVQTSLVPGDYYRDERQFEYWLEVTHDGNKIDIGRTKVAQVITMGRAAATGSLAFDFRGSLNYSYVGEIDRQISPDEVRALLRAKYDDAPP
ncbi:MAG: hypothetical protein JNG86_22940, partial [Verrucomicrobiaceae bacterium]|nr:hypothetical protein [Verrucomicrobiaceae bacterium]